MIQLGKETRIGPLNLDDDHELAQLAKQFDQMLDLLRKQKNELEQAAVALEGKLNTEPLVSRKKQKNWNFISSFSIRHATS